MSGIKTTIKSKPIRIIIALCIIAVIMIAVSIGISILVKNLTDKCANQPGTDWDSDLKKCVKRGCQNVCQKSGSCDDNMCTGSSVNGYPFVYDENLCECVLDCSKAGENSNGMDNEGREYKSFYWDGSTSTPMDSHGKPIKELYCGVKCDSATVNEPSSHTGKNNCPETSLCGINKYINGETFHEGRCLPGYFSTCPSPNVDDNACVKLDDCIIHNGKQRCKIEYCSTDENQNMLALYDAEKSICTDVKGKKDSPANLNTLKTKGKDFSKFSQNLKYCPYKSTAIKGASKYCVTMSGLAETTTDGGENQ